MVGLPLAPGLAALVPVVPRNACTREQGRRLEPLGREAALARSRPGHRTGRTLSSPRLASPLSTRESAAVLRCHHTRAAQPAPFNAAAMLVPPAAPARALLRAPAPASAAQTRAPPSSGLFVAEGRGADSANLAARQDGVGLSSLLYPGPNTKRNSPMARRRLERENARRHGPVCKTQSRPTR